MRVCNKAGNWDRTSLRDMSQAIVGAGDGEVVLLLHGFPTNEVLYEVDSHGLLLARALRKRGNER